MGFLKREFGAANAQTWQWAKYANSIQNERCAAVSVDHEAGDLYTVGSTSGVLSEYSLPATSATDGYVAKYKPNGNLVWAFLLNGVGLGELLDVVVDSATHNFYVTGYVTGATTITGVHGNSFVTPVPSGQDLLIAAFDSSGAVLWYAVEGGSGNDQGVGITVDANSVYLTGSFQIAADFDGATGGPITTVPGPGSRDWFVAKYDKLTGALDWAVGNTNGSNMSRGNAITVDGTRVYVCGGFNSSNTRANGTSGAINVANSSSNEFDIFVFALRKTDGLAFWGYGAGAIGNDDEAFGIAVDANALYMGGEFEGTANFPPLGNFATGSNVDGYVSRHNPATGDAQWVNVIGNFTGSDLQRVNDVDVDGTGNVLATGTYAGSVNLPSNSTPTVTLAAAGPSDLFLASLNSAGALVFAERAGGTGNDGGNEVSAFDQNMAYVGGVYNSGASVFGTVPSTTLPLQGGEDILVAKYGLCFAYADTSIAFTANPMNMCIGQATTVTIVASEFGVTYQLVDSATGTPLGGTLLGNGGNISFPPLTLTMDTTIFVEAWYNDPACKRILNSSVRVNILPSPLPNIGPDSSVCPGQSILLDAGPGYTTYAWSTSQSTSSITGATPGTYSVTVSDGSGCLAADTMVFAWFPQPTVDIGPDTSVCTGESITLDAGPGFTSYNWTGAQTTQTITTTGPGLYDVQVVDGNGCPAVDTMQLLWLPNPMVVLRNDTAICPYDAVVLDAGPGLNYAWSTGNTTQTITVSVAGQYNVTVTNGNGCMAADSFVLGTLAVPMVDLGADTAFCAGGSLVLDAGNPGATFTWAHGPVTQTVVVSSSGTYSVIVDAALGCQGRDTIALIVNPLPILALPDTGVVCAGDSLQLNPGVVGSTYLWSTGATSPIIYVTAVGTYYVDLLDANGCAGSDTTVVMLAPPPVVNLGNDTSICAGDTLVLAAGNGGAGYAWSTGASTSSVSVSAGGTYSVTVTDFNGCKASDTLVLGLLAAPAVNLISDTSICMGDTLALSIPPTVFSVLWSDGATGTTINVSTAGFHWVQVTDTHGCIGSDSVRVSLLVLPSPQLGNDTTICLGSTLVLDVSSTGVSYVWNTGATTGTLTVNGNTSATYAVTVTDTSGCQGSASVAVRIQVPPTVNLGPDTTVCDGDSVTVSGGVGMGNAQLLWSNGSTAAAIWISQAGDYWLRATDSIGCASADTVRLTVAALPQVSIGLLLSEYCSTDPGTQLAGNPAGGSWSGTVTGGGYFDPAVAGGGNHAVVYACVDSLGCAGADTQTTQVGLPPSPAVAGPDQMVSTQVTLQAGSIAVGTGQWSVGAFPGTISNVHDPQAVLTFDVSGTYPFVWTVENPPCAPSSDTVWITFEGLHIPTGFSPNGDGVNDAYVIRGLAGYPGAKLDVYNRWGNQVWVSEDYQNHWDGANQNGQPLVEDTYYVILEYGEKKMTTYVVLKR